MTAEQFVYHIISAEEWNQTSHLEYYRAESLESEGFIHCSFAHQINGVVKLFYNGRDDLLVLKIEVVKLLPAMKVDPIPGGGAFPHIYGSINLSAISGVYSIIREGLDYSWYEE
jgi:uncharacterized protein (DUF952 family)